MQYYDVNFLKSAAQMDQWPDSSLPEIIFAGRSNAGKSSLINALTNRKAAAFVGKTPGKTKLLNFFSVNDEVMFCDAPGYGYAKGGTHAAKSFGSLLEPYFNHRDVLAGMLLVLDIRRIPNEDDMTMINFAREVHLPITVACVKCDKVSKSERIRQIKKICATLNIAETSAVPCSSLKREGMDEVWNQIRRMIDSRS